MGRSRPSSSSTSTRKYNGWGIQQDSTEQIVDEKLGEEEDKITDALRHFHGPMGHAAALVDAESPSSGGKSTTHLRGPFSGMGLATVVTLVVGGLSILFLVLACLIVAVHRVQEGHLGVYYKNGALMSETSSPGIHWLQPFATEVMQVQVTPETKMLNPLICTTRDGVRNIFRDIQVISSLDPGQVLDLVRRYTPKMKHILVYDRVEEAIQLFCANHSIDEVYNTKFLSIQSFVVKTVRENLERFAPNGSVVLWKIFLPKPDVPPAIAANYRQVKIEWTEQLVAQQKQRTQQILKETEKQKAVADADRLKAVKAIETAKMIEVEEGKKNISKIRDSAMSDRLRAEADASSYVDNSKAESNQKLLTDNYIKLQLAKSLTNNTKMFFSGEESGLGAILSQLLQVKK